MPPRPMAGSPPSEAPASITRRSFLEMLAWGSVLPGPMGKCAVAHAQDAARPRRRRVWLRRLEQSLRGKLDQQQPFSESQRFVAGLLTVERVYVDQEEHDLILEGPAEEEWQTFQGHTALGKSSRQPLLCIDDLAVALRNTFLSREPPTFSLEPRVDSLRRVAEILKQRGVPKGPEEAEQLRDEIQRNWGDQDGQLLGVPEDSRFALVMAYADWEMKRVSLGLAAATPKELTPYIDLEFRNYTEEVRRRGAEARQPASGSRFWFIFTDEPFLASEDETAFELPRQTVRLVTESYYRSATFGAQMTPPTPAAQEFADTFTELYDALAATSPVFHDLRNLFRFVALAKLIQELKLFEHLKWDLTFWLRQLPIHRVPAPSTLPGLVAIRTGSVPLKRGQTTARIVLPAWGGVSMFLRPGLRLTPLRTGQGV
jgi:hypothetical protein